MCSRKIAIAILAFGVVSLQGCLSNSGEVKSPKIRILSQHPVHAHKTPLTSHNHTGSTEMLERELEIAKQIAINEGSPESIEYFRELYRKSVVEAYNPDEAEMKLDDTRLRESSQIILNQPRANVMYFNFDSTTLSKPEDANTSLLLNAEYLKSRPKAQVMIAGFADLKGNADYNLKLGKRRAEVVAGLLTKQGVSVSQLSVVTFGENYTPQSAQYSDEESSRWRKVEIIY